MKTKQFSLRSRIRSFRFALQGIVDFFMLEHNALIHLLATVLVLAGVWYYRLTNNEVAIVLIVTGFVWGVELVNTAIERLADFIHPEQHDSIKLIKDLSAAAVLIAAFTAVAAGAFIFIPKIF
ncbi:MAG: diacylglycerol kinase family protein [Chitinophagaceae bacterium]|nr:diacylglycerol kinase family protein [Chitinophagaceae bacterium]